MSSHAWELSQDWTGLCQKDASGERSDPENASFRYALDRMQVLYAHQSTTVVVLASRPEGWQRPSYEDSGWPTFEHAVASIGAKQANYMRWAPIFYADGGMPRVTPPLSPAAFDTLIRTKRFASGADAEVVSRLYAQTFRSAIVAREKFVFNELGWNGEDAEDLMEALCYARACGQLQIYSNPIGDRGAAAVAAAKSAGAMPELWALGLGGCAIGDEGLRKLAGMVAEGSFAPSRNGGDPDAMISVRGNAEGAGLTALQAASEARGGRPIIYT